MALNILLNGCSGRMGIAISEIVEALDFVVICAGVDKNQKKKFDYPIFSSAEDVNIPFDVIIDFSNPSAVLPIIDFASKTSKPIVIATTGLEETHISAYKKLSKKVPVFVSANMSLGINMIIRLAQQAAASLYDDFNIEIIEAHHNQKLDAPSGTALMIADSLKEKIDPSIEYNYDRHCQKQVRPVQEIGIHSIRGGTIPGDHKIIFAGEEEVIEITHRAQSRRVFAQGAIRAAKFIFDKPAGLYSMNDLLEV